MSEPILRQPVKIPLCEPEIRGREWEYVKECLDSKWVSSVGSYVDRFETTLAQYIGTKHGVALVNGTAALHIALLAAGIEPDEEVLVSNLTFIAPVNAITYARAIPVLMDAEPEYWQMDPAKVVDFITKECRWNKGRLVNKTSGRRIRAILPVHILGHPVDMDPILEVARKFNLIVIEDAAESLGATYKGRSVGTLGDAACFSFNGNKLITTGGGGMITTDREDWASRAKYLSTQAKDDPVEYIHETIGYNYRLPNTQAAMGCGQLEHLEEFLAAKRKIAALYTRAFADVRGLTCLGEAAWAKSAFWLFAVLVNEAEFGLSSRGLMERLAGLGVQTRPLWQPLSQSRAHRECQSHKVDVSQRLHHQGLALPSSVGLSEAEINYVIDLMLKLSKG